MRTAALTLEERLSLIRAWFLGSGIQSESGGLYAWQDIRNKSNSYLYSEITGYAITFLCFMNAVKKDKSLIDRAAHAAQWIMQDALDPSGGVLTRKYAGNAVEHYSFERGNIYSFDCAIVAFGMLKLFRATGDGVYLECARKIVSFLNDKMLRTDGLYNPVFDTKNNTALKDADKWSAQSGSFHCKIAMCLCELADIDKEASYKTAAKRLIDSAVSNFYKDGRFITNTFDGSSHFHPYSYTLEGIAYYRYKTGDDSYDGITRGAYANMLKRQAEDGGFPTQVFARRGVEILHQRSDIQAQALRLSYIIGGELDREKLLERLVEFQNIILDPKGAFIFGTDWDGYAKEHGNAWCSMFAFQALSLASGSATRDQVLEHLV
ncbi:MAG: hypothetical protein A3I73_00155 [Omnitrophica bacterium RIFCSPLOWO2_02_FULL_45_16]|nr:MAG: hypothetical protein A3C51_06675 [Omnitrophica bacterium RIFCSPHIGHO2_02_FULL_46_20]OGW93916.1 MAG: hypothetical protein A3G36_03690 [Omnitrophica bacterium RIFCSPLOWO2_12_FULL_45_13]OGW94918.1 MAG: hypothetical protein A3K16_05050 [Omnitrophica bacterium RIFCSPLOWO2_01_FULL_45_24]OGX01306.1 MAG: hypothetical protein A3I73_00155 [Omnitrophica bacterium RIFCSPLOWO2_02_FULL_45_16]